MSLVFILIALMPGIALAGPTLIGVAFDADWVLEVGLGFDLAAVVLGGAACWFVRSSWVEAGAPPPIGRALATAAGIGLVGFGLLFGGLSAWYLFRDRESESRSE